MFDAEAIKARLERRVSVEMTNAQFDEIWEILCVHRDTFEEASDNRIRIEAMIDILVSSGDEPTSGN